MERQLVKKTYYKMFMKEGEKREPIAVLGDAFHEEQMKATFDLTYIRYAQGEVYFHNKDYEAAIYKWENISNDLESWAKKNIGDAYFAAGMLVEAEKMYSMIQTENKVLSIETMMKLIDLYAERNNTERVYQSIQKALQIDPDYPYVTETARVFYEQQLDWEKAVDLAISEANRIDSLQWFEKLIEYIEEGYTTYISPGYFRETLVKLSTIDQSVFVKFIQVLCSSYHGNDMYLQYVKLLNEILDSIDIHTQDIWNELTTLHRDCYLDLLSGQYIVTELRPIIPDLLRNWLNNTSTKTKLFPAAAVMAWNEVFPESFDLSTLHYAEKYLFQENLNPNSSPLHDSLQLFDTLKTWAESNNFALDGHKKTFANVFANVDQKNYLLTGTSVSNTSMLMRILTEENVVAQDKPTWFMQGQKDSHTVTGDLQDIRTVYVDQPSSFLERGRCSVLYSPNRLNDMENTDFLQYLHFSDGVLYVIDLENSSVEEALTSVMKLKENTGNMPVHIIISSTEQGIAETEVNRFIQELRQIGIKSNTGSSIIQVKSTIDSVTIKRDLLAAIKTNESTRDGFHTVRTSKVLYLMRLALTDLLSGREVKEKNINDKIQFDNDILRRLKSLDTNLRESESEYLRTIIDSYRTVKIDMQKDIAEKIPKLLREFASTVSEDSDFRHLHEQLNKQMNEKINAYFSEELVPRVQSDLRDWLSSVQLEMAKNENYLKEMSNSFNKLYKEEKVNLCSDIKVIEDWRRDIHRMTSRMDIPDDLNIMNRSKPAQLILKGVGKLFGGIQQNKALLFKQYKKYLESESFIDVCDAIMAPFINEFDVFEKALRADIKLFFEQPFEELSMLIGDTEYAIEAAKETLNNMKARPEVFYDPLRIFEVRLLQLDFINKSTEEYPINIMQ